VSNEAKTADEAERRRRLAPIVDLGDWFFAPGCICTLERLEPGCPVHGKVNP